MKYSIRLPFLFLLYLILFVILFTTLELLHDTGLKTSQRQTDPKAAVYGLMNMPANTLKVFPIACFISLILVFPSTLKHKGSRFLNFLLPLAVASAVLVGGYLGLRTIKPTNTFKPSAEFFLNTGQFNFSGSGTIWLSSLVNNTAQNVFFIDTEHKKIEYFKTALVSINDSAFSLTDNATGRVFFQAPTRPVNQVLFETDKSIEAITDDFKYLNTQLEDLYGKSKSRIEFIALCVVLMYAITCLSAILRLTRWPLFNFLLYLTACRGVLFLYYLVKHDFMQNILAGYAESSYLRFLPTIMLAILATLVLLFDIIFLADKYWKQGPAHA